MNSSKEKVAPGTEKPKQDQDRTIPAKEPVKSAPAPARGDDDVMSQQEQKS